MRRNKQIKYIVGIFTIIFILGLIRLNTRVETFPKIKEDKVKSTSNSDIQNQSPAVPGTELIQQHTDDDNELIDWHNYTQIEEEKRRVGPGEQGVGLRTDQSEKKKYSELYYANGFNALASDKISLSRALKDIRHPDCRTMKYRRKLLSVSLVIPFHQEHWSTLLRTFISALNRAPKGLIKEVILVDDFSKKPFLKKPLDDYLEANYKGLVRVVRAKKREGLIRTRLLGAKEATGDVLIFLDSHCECSVNWLPPLLDPIANNYKTVVCPFIDVLNWETLDYHPQDEGARGAFDWEFFYKRLPRLPEDNQHPAQPFDSPVMAGGLFAISRKWFWELGGYDPGLEIWGGEQYELSFKIWQCGGRMIDAPCSRVGHIYRNYAPFPNPGIGDFLGVNYKRLAEVWMDEYKHYIYKRKPEYYKNIKTGDISKQLEIRERLKCKPFKWFMTEIAFDLIEHYPMVEPEIMAEGEIRNVAANLCLDSKFKKMENLMLDDCMKDGKLKNGEQHFQFTWRKDIRPGGRDVCFDFTDGTSAVILYHCHNQKGNQHWQYDIGKQNIIHHSTGKCLDSKPERKELLMAKCSNAQTQKWQFEKMNQTLINKAFYK